MIRESYFYVAVEPEMTIRQVKQEIQAQTGIQIGKQSLLEGGIVLGNKHTLSHYKVRHNDSLKLYIILMSTYKTSRIIWRLLKNFLNLKYNKNEID